jgi:ATP-dependent DNA helicase RecQ
MGIDRSNIRFVLHAAMPKSIEAYQQETGRAGRDGLEAECVLLHSAEDLFTWRFLIEKSAKDAAATGTPIAADYVPTAMRHLDDIDRFARGATCRHKALVEYFGQAYDAAVEATGCGACDHCLGDTTVVPEGVVIAQKILSAIARTDQRFGVNHIVGILRGANTERMRQLGHDRLPTYGLLSEHSEGELRGFIYQLIGQGALAQESLILASGRTAPILKFTGSSVAVMKAQKPVRLVQMVHKTAAEARKTRGEAVSWEGVDQELFEGLRSLRKQIAGERGVPPYVVFSDATLRELARVRPTTMQNFRLIYGVGENKLKEFGERFVGFIAEHCKARGVGADVSGVGPAKKVEPEVAGPRLSTSRREAAAMFRQGATIEDVAQQMGRAASTVTEYLVEYIHAERPASIAAWVNERVYKEVVAVKEKLGTDRLKELFLALQERVPYDQIRLVVAHLQNP